MTSRILSRLSYANIMATFAVFLALGGGAYAMSTSAATVNSCVNRHSGVLRVLAHGTKCARSERALTFDQKGLPGASGPAGVQGAAGIPGLNGVDGAPGAAIVARASGSSTLTSAGSSADYPLSGATWTQGANEDDIIVGSVVIAASPTLGPGAGQCDAAGGRGLLVNVLVNGVNVGQEAFFVSSIGSMTVRLPSTTGVSFAGNELPLVLSTGTARQATVSVLFDDDCATTAHYTISAIRLDVIRQT